MFLFIHSVFWGALFNQGLSLLPQDLLRSQRGIEDHHDAMAGNKKEMESTMGRMLVGCLVVQVPSMKCW